MNVLHLDAGREMRGGQWQVIRLLRGLRTRGHQSVLLARAKSPLLERARREQFTCDTIDFSAVRYASGQAQILHAHDAKSHTYAAVASKIPFIVSRRVIFPVKSGVLSKWKYTRAKFYAAVSGAVAEELRKAGVPERKIRVVYDGVPLLPNTWEFRGPVILPRFGDERKANSLPAEAVKLAQAAAVRSTHLEADLAGASMLLYLTYSEGLGSAAILAMSAGIPVIASDVGGLREVVCHGVTGLLVPNEVNAVARAIVQLRQSPDAAREMSVRARERVAERFSEDRMVTETIALYERALSESDANAN